MNDNKYPWGYPPAPYEGRPLTHCANCRTKLSQSTIDRETRVHLEHGVPDEYWWAHCRACEYERDALHAYLDSVSKDYHPT